MIQREDILSMEYFKKTEYTGCHEGMRYRLEGMKKPDSEDGEKVMRCAIWPEPYNFVSTPEEEKEYEYFTFDEDGILDAIRWMNNKLFEEKERWDAAADHWDV